MEVIVALQNHKDIRLELDIKCTVGQIKTGLYQVLKQEGCKSELRILYRGKELKEGDRISDIENDIFETKKIVLYAVRPFAKSEAYKRVNNVRLLHRNVIECVKCAQNDIEPTERKRFNEPEFPTSPVPNVIEVADEISDIGETFALMSNNMKEMSKVLQSKEILSGINYDKGRRIIQNNMDCVRYTDPMLLNMTKLRFPIMKPTSLVYTMETCLDFGSAV